MMKKIMFVSSLTFALVSCSSSQGTSSSNKGTSTKTQKTTQEVPKKDPDSTPITTPPNKVTTRSLIQLPVE